MKRHWIRNWVSKVVRPKTGQIGVRAARAEGAERSVEVEVEEADEVAEAVAGVVDSRVVSEVHEEFRLRSSCTQLG